MEPILATDGQALQVLRSEFPNLPAEELPSYRIRYASGSMTWNMGRQLPRIGLACLREHQVIARLVRRYEPLAIISDNRFGCFHAQTPSVFISHQLNIRTASPPLTRWVNRLNHSFLRQYDECWVPDWKGKGNLSGALSSPLPLPESTFFMGHLTRFQLLPAEESGYDIVFLLSGPEPQRTVFENLLLDQSRTLAARCLMLGGKTDERTSLQGNGLLAYVPFMGSSALREVLATARLVVCRSGYSTLMDLSVLGKRALLVPTPGQTEQEYLAQRISQAGWCYSQKQSALDLSIDVPKAFSFPGLPPQPPNDLTPFLKKWLERIRYPLESTRSLAQ